MRKQTETYKLDWLENISHFVTVAGAVLAGVLAWNYIAYFTADAKIQLQLQYMNVSYDDRGISTDFANFAVGIPWDLIPDRGTVVSMLDSCSDFRERQNVAMVLSTDRFKAELDSELRKAIKYEFRERAGSRRLPQQGFSTNRAYWEVTFPEALAALRDTILFHQAMRVVLARRLVTVMLVVGNSGDIPAREINLLLRNPWFLDSRFLMTQVSPQFVTVEPDMPGCKVVNSGSYATLTIPYLNPGDAVLAEVTTSMTNLTLDNIFEYHDSAPKLKALSVLGWWITVTCAFLAIPLLPQIAMLIRRILTRTQT